MEQLGFDSIRQYHGRCKEMFAPDDSNFVIHHFADRLQIYSTSYQYIEIDMDHACETPDLIKPDFSVSYLLKVSCKTKQNSWFGFRNTPPFIEDHLD